MKQGEEAARLREALALMEKAVNESVSGQRKVGVEEWLGLLAVAQTALREPLDNSG